MHKIILIKQISSETNIAQKDIAILLDSLQKNITKSLKKGEDVNIIGFGSFKIVKTNAIIGRNPRTGKEIKIKAGRKIRFKVGRVLKNFIK